MTNNLFQLKNRYWYCVKKSRFKILTGWNFFYISSYLQWFTEQKIIIRHLRWTQLQCLSVNVSQLCSYDDLEFRNMSKEDTIFYIKTSKKVPPFYKISKHIDTTVLSPGGRNDCIEMQETWKHNLVVLISKVVIKFILHILNTTVYVTQFITYIWQWILFGG